ncbi:putative lipoprotein [Brevibacillus laterosporus GI-9]|uniref:hypothetical protein n=1 Tax=Brevibacillus laterosporus TaxID=1465 RepID=UPI0002405483|nr:hypothetical protein [Brevibacillus laterosporus]CCF16791.1 putative lipoprotein [Brevibacillus laterosporus GI-9]
MSYRKITFFASIILMIFIMSLCNKVEFDNIFFNNETPIRAEEDKSTSIMGLILDDSTTALTDKQETYVIKESFAPTVGIINDFPKENSYLLLFFLDYRQIDVLFEGTLTKEIRVDVAKRSSKKMRIQLPEIEKGRHDFLVVLIRKPGSHLTKTHFVPSQDYYLSRRATLINGIDKMPQVEFIKVIATEAVNIPNNLLFLSSKKPNSTSDILSLVNTKDINGNLFLNYSTNRSNNQFAIITLLDNKQVSTPPIYIQTNSKGLTNIPLNINIPIDNKPHEISNILIENPYERIEDDNKKYQNIPWDVKFTNKMTFK